LYQPGRLDEGDGQLCAVLAGFTCATFGFHGHRNGRFVWVWIKKCGIYHGFSLLDRLVKRKNKPEKYDGGGLEILPERSANLWTWTIVDQIDLSVEL
jgi:hypothetical protein